MRIRMGRGERELTSAQKGGDRVGDAVNASTQCFGDVIDAEHRVFPVPARLACRAAGGYLHATAPRLPRRRASRSQDPFSVGRHCHAGQPERLWPLLQRLPSQRVWALF